MTSSVPAGDPVMNFRRGTPEAPSAPSPDSISPTSPESRVDLIDIVRGFALFGVFLGNIVWTSQDFGLTDGQREALSSAAWDECARALVLIFIDKKFYTLFSILFGLGFALQLSRAAARGQDVLPVYVRRLAVLLVIGITHGFLLWFGDILQIYAIAGFGLILFRSRKDRTVLVWCVALAVVTALLPLADWAAGGTAPPEVEGETKAMRFAAITGNRWMDVIRMNAAFQYDFYGHLDLRADENIYWFLAVFWKFLLGFFIGRRLLLQQAERHLPLFRRVLPWALAAGLAGNALWLAFEAGALGESPPLIAALWIPIEIGILGLSLAYLSALVLLFQRPAWKQRLSLLAPVGRMALTNYLAQSVLIVAVFYGVGLGLMGKIGAALCIPIAILLFAVLTAVSRWWLGRFRFGPAEWLWRSLTYGRAQPLRASVTAAALPKGAPRGPRS